VIIDTNEGFTKRDFGFFCFSTKISDREISQFTRTSNIGWGVAKNFILKHIIYITFFKILYTIICILSFMKEPNNFVQEKDSFFSDKFHSAISGEIGKSNSLAIKESSQKILSRLESDEKGRKAGIMYGKIQSGKTSNFLALIAYCFDQNYTICVLLNSPIISIAEQNKKRLEVCFMNEEEIKILLVEKDKNQVENEVGEALHRKWIEKGKKIIIVMPKHHSWLEKVNKFISENPKLFGDKVLIIDDEGDQASLSNNATKKNSKASKTNDLINEMRDLIPNHAYVFVTATPFANIIVDNRDKMSSSFIELIRPGQPHGRKKYYGLSELWDEGEIYKQTIRIIDEKEPKKLFKNTQPPLSLKKALSTFLVGATILERERGDGLGYEMIINPHVNLKPQRVVAKKIKFFIEELKGSFEKNDNYFESFVWEGWQELESTTKITENISLSELIDLVKITVRECKIDTLNSESNSKESEQTTTNKIYIGARSIGRGLSFKNLIVSYITNRAKKAQNTDTTLQQARWFGYKSQKMLQFSRVWCTERIDKDYRNLKNMEERLWESIEGLNKKEIPLSEWIESKDGGFVLDDKDQKLTRSGVGRTTRIKPLEKYLQYRPMENSEKEKEFYQKLVSENYASFVDGKSIYDDERHKEKAFKDLEDFREFLTPELFSHVFKKIRVPSEILRQINEFSVVNSIKVRFVIANLEEETRKQTLTNGETKNFFIKTEKWQGSEENYYFWPVNKEEIMLQVWKYSVWEKEELIDKEQFWYAFFLPNKFSGNIKGIITKKTPATQTWSDENNE
jgi:hypothetical protein